MAFLFGLRRNDRRRGDRFRDAGQWQRAEIAYSAHLARNPDDAPIHVQLGHAFKQQGKVAEAADAYQEGARLLGEDADSLTHWADALFSLDRLSDAAEAYRRSYAARPVERVLRRLMLLGDSPDGSDPRSLEADSIVYSIQDFFGYLRAHPALSGIQRVEAGLILQVLDAREPGAHFVLTFSPTRPDTLLSGEFWRVDDAMLRSIVQKVSTDPIDHADLRLMLARCEAMAARVRPTAGSTIVVLGAFWSYDNGADRFMAAKRDGIRIGFYVYDLIPVTHGAFCSSGLVENFRSALAEMVAIADFILTISAFTRSSLLAYLVATESPIPPIATVPLARCKPGGIAESRRPAILDIIGTRPYAVYVATIEGRKNHIYLVEAWQRMMADGVDVPDLLFVGRLGSQIDALTEVLRSTSWLDGRVHHAQHLSDAELNAVYADSLFTLFPSLVEGWGLPIGESLSHGRPCVASRASSIPEVGGELVDYLDPASIDDGVEVLRRMILDGAYRAERSALITEQFVTRSWDDVGRDFVAAIRTLVKGARAATGLYRPICLPGERMIDLTGSPASSFAAEDYTRHPVGLLFDSFYPAGPGGIWMRGRSGRIRLAEGLVPGEPFVVALKLIVAPWGADGQVHLSSSGMPEATLLLPVCDLDPSGLVRCVTCADIDGVLSINFAWSGALAGPPDDARRYAIGLGALGYARRDGERISFVTTSSGAG